MANNKGQIFTQFMYGGETTYATAATRTTVLSRSQSFDPKEENNFIKERGLGEGVNLVKIYYGPFKCSATQNFNVTDFDFLKHFVGPKSGDGSAGDPWTLTEATAVTEGTTGLQPFSFEAANSSSTSPDVLLFTGAVGNTFSLSGDINSILNCNVTFFGSKTSKPSSVTTYTASTENSFTMINGTWKWGATPSALSGVRRFTLDYTNGFNPEDYRDIDSRFIGLPTLPGARGYTGTVTVATSSTLATTIYTGFYGQTPSDGPEDGSNSIEATTDLEFKIELINGSKYANIWLDQCAIDDVSEPVAIGGGLSILTFTYTAKYGKDNAPIRWWSV